ncbi:uncharacterized protein BXZ73DRAFT_105884 [Epithele typhae]|uniref:uncharacterized protein n=1 Tax=Epithele typhae TaxID=378194 RepID=UPI0020088655|nr:uncharacterized protein BXZ73DRAFT_105884 [Epithele typhae]KAH9916254.1 hypothetical protein BXZ73DRAFT_105884 [Epithele typhae]
MSSLASAGAEILTAQSAFAVRYVSTLAFVILYYDYFLTLGPEVDRYWKGGFSLVSCGYFLNRYLSLFGHVPVMIEFYMLHDEVMSVHLCTRFQVYHQLLSGVTQVIVGLLQVLRLYALYGRNRRIVVSLLTVIGLSCGTSWWAATKTWHASDPTASDLSHDPRFVGLLGCGLGLTSDQGFYIAIVWATVLVFDVIVFALTAYRVLRVGKKWHGSLFTLLLRDGALYFGVLAMFHLTNILTCLLAQPAYRGISVTATNVLSTSLIGRLMLNIRDPDARDVLRWPSDVELSAENAV